MFRFPIIVQMYILCTSWVILADFDTKSELNQTFFYHNYGYGSDATLNPLSTIINGGFFITLSNNNSNRLDYLNYQTASKNVINNLKHPLKSIKGVGWKNFLSSEIFPLSFKTASAQYIPNWTLHFIGCGSDYQAMLEWYQSRNFQMPRAWTFLTFATGRFLNEMQENGNYQGTSVDAIADMYIFDPLGILFFELDRVSAFFSKKLNLANWSYQPMVSTGNTRIENVGDHYSVKYFPSDKVPVGLLVCAGINSSIGLSLRRPDGNSFSVGGGCSVGDIITVSDSDSARVQSVTTTWNASFYYDRNNSLMASVILSGNRRYLCQANFYPGLITWKKFKPGLFLAVTNKRKLLTGINCSWTPVGITF